MKAMPSLLLALVATVACADDTYTFEDFGFSVTAPADWNAQDNKRVTEQYLAINKKFGHDAKSLEKQSLILLTVTPKDYTGDMKQRPALVCAGLFQDKDPRNGIASSRELFIKFDGGAKVSEIMSLEQSGLNIASFSVINEEKDQNLIFYGFNSNGRMAVCTAGFTEAYKADAERFLASVAKLEP